MSRCAISASTSPGPALLRKTASLSNACKMSEACCLQFRGANMTGCFKHASGNCRSDASKRAGPLNSSPSGSGACRGGTTAGSAATSAAPPSAQMEHKKPPHGLHLYADVLLGTRAEHAAHAPPHFTALSGWLQPGHQSDTTAACEISNGMASACWCTSAATMTAGAGSKSGGTMPSPAFSTTPAGGVTSPATCLMHAAHTSAPHCSQSNVREPGVGGDLHFMQVFPELRRLTKSRQHRGHASAS